MKYKSGKNCLLNFKLNKNWALIILWVAMPCIAFAQSQKKITPEKIDSIATPQKKVYKNRYDSATKAHSPRVAAIRSALLPGLGQIYNKKYWKLPIVYGALGTTAGIFIYNLGYYKDTRFAYKVKYNMRVYHTDSSLYNQIKNELKPIDENSLRSYRNQFRRDLDYTAIFFLVFWGLNVVDAAVDAHLKSFDVSPDLSLQIKPGYSDMAQTSGISLVLKIGK